MRETIAKHKGKVTGAGLAAAIAIAANNLPNDEGVRYYVYRDPVGIPTYCVGETQNPQWGHKYTPEECRTILGGRLKEFADGVLSCVTVPVSPQRMASFIQFSYNIGTGGFCKSTLVKRINAGDPNACDEMRKWTTAAGIRLQGLVNRRERERKLCMAG